MSDKQKAGGLAGVIAGETAISTVGKEGVGLTYRGYSIGDLARNASFEEVAYLLHYGRLPEQKELEAYRRELMELRELPEALKGILESLPDTAHPMDVLRTGCAALGCIEPESEIGEPQRVADRLLAVFPGMLIYWYHFSHRGERIDCMTDDPSVAGHFLQLLHGKAPKEQERQALNVSLILYAEHEFNASTFAARVTASTLSDFYSAITSAIGTLRGTLHGGANEAALRLIRRYRTPEEAEQGVLAALAAKDRIMGFGHRVYTVSDPRSEIIKPWAKRLADEVGDRQVYAVSERIESVMWREKRLFANLDFYSAPAYFFLEIPTLMFTPIFVFARVAGWSAHIMEQRGDNRLIRPTADYIGPEPRAYTPVEQRSEKTRSAGG